jgi:hypothetical protein
MPHSTAIIKSMVTPNDLICNPIGVGLADAHGSDGWNGDPEWRLQKGARSLILQTRLSFLCIVKTSFSRSCGKWPRSKPIDVAQDVGNQVSWDFEVDRLGADITPVAHDLDQPVSERRCRPSAPLRQNRDFARVRILVSSQ